MPDKRKHRGAHPDDAHLFAPANHESLRAAVCEYSWLLTRGYAQDSGLKLVGDRHGLTARQRMAVMRSACSDVAMNHRRSTEVSLGTVAGGALGVDGYNLLITIESALSGGLILVGRDGCCRDLASVHGTYRKVEETKPAIELIADYLTEVGVTTVHFWLDRPVSNSGRLRALMEELLTPCRADWEIELVDNPDPVLAEYDGPVASSDSWVLDRCDSWVNLAAAIIDARVPKAWRVALQ